MRKAIIIIIIVSDSFLSPSPARSMLVVYPRRLALYCKFSMCKKSLYSDNASNRGDVLALCL